MRYSFSIVRIRFDSLESKFLKSQNLSFWEFLYMKSNIVYQNLIFPIMIAKSKNFICLALVIAYHMSYQRTNRFYLMLFLKISHFTHVFKCWHGVDNYFIWNRTLFTEKISCLWPLSGKLIIPRFLHIVHAYKCLKSNTIWKIITFANPQKK